VAHRMAPLGLLVTFSDFECHFCCWNLSNSHSLPREIQQVLTTICLHMNRKKLVAC